MAQLQKKREEHTREQRMRQVLGGGEQAAATVTSTTKQHGLLEWECDFGNEDARRDAILNLGPIS